MNDATVLSGIARIGNSAIVVQADPALVLEGAKALAQLRAHAKAQRVPSPEIGDGVILATARRFGVGVPTGDPHVELLPEAVRLAPDGP